MEVGRTFDPTQQDSSIRLICVTGADGGDLLYKDQDVAELPAG